MPSRLEIVITGRKSGADMARLYNVSQSTVSRIVAYHRLAHAGLSAWRRNCHGSPACSRC